MTRAKRRIQGGRRTQRGRPCASEGTVSATILRWHRLRDAVGELGNRGHRLRPWCCGARAGPASRPAEPVRALHRVGARAVRGVNSDVHSNQDGARRNIESLSAWYAMNLRECFSSAARFPRKPLVGNPVNRGEPVDSSSWEYTRAEGEGFKPPRALINSPPPSWVASGNCNSLPKRLNVQGRCRTRRA